MKEIGVLLFPVSVACIRDVRTGKIPNILILIIMAMGMGLGMWNHGLAGAIEYIVRFSVYIAAAYPLYGIGAVGAGDVKLLAGIEGCFVWTEGVVCLGWILAAAGALALVKWMISGRKATFPMSVPMLIGLTIHLLWLG